MGFYTRTEIAADAIVALNVSGIPYTRTAFISVFSSLNLSAD